MDVRALFVAPSDPIRAAVERIDAGRCGAAIAVDDEQRLLGVVTDGDVRRALLAHIDLERPVRVLLDRRPRDLYPEAVSALVSTGTGERLALMRGRRIRHLPIVDAEGRVVEFETLDALVDGGTTVNGVVMAGGFGVRMRPLTDCLPKPLLPVGAKPVLGHLLSHLAASGVRDLTIATHYRGQQIREHFGDGATMGVALRYVEEEEPLGTAGVLRRLPPQTQPLLVINGDILTRVDVPAMVRFHREHKAMLTVGIRAFETQVPYGVVEVDGERVVGVLEKPRAQHFINAGLYLIEPAALKCLPQGPSRLDMPEFISALIAGRHNVVGFPIREYWLDIGHPEQYAQAQTDMAEGRY